MRGLDRHNMTSEVPPHPVLRTDLSHQRRGEKWGAGRVERLGPLHDAMKHQSQPYSFLLPAVGEGQDEGVWSLRFKLRPSPSAGAVHRPLPSGERLNTFCQDQAD